MTARRLLAFIGASLLGLSFTTASEGQTADTGVTVFNGRLDTAAADNLVARLQTSSILHITSPGGDEAAALEVGRVVLARRIRVVVDDHCLSSCANLIFAVSPDAVIVGRGIVGYHTSAIAIEDIYRSLGEAPTAQVSALASGYRALYEAAGVDLALLRCAGEQIGLTDQRIVDTDPRTGAIRTGWKSIRSWWVPDAATLNSFGASVTGGMADTDAWRAEVRQRLRARNMDAVRFASPSSTRMCSGGD